ncbi:hypothetical protein [Timonella senegalensis]|uniref:hypothetical protein n=1 Tax=Timonella senegalensis TaxID=1465825 RepID=UPI000594AED1|nr:hypothetical protein [Timonella senegalensis]
MTVPALPSRISRPSLISALHALGLQPSDVKSFAFIPNGIPAPKIDPETGEEIPGALDALEVVVFERDNTGARSQNLPGVKAAGYRKSTHRIPVL